MAAVMLFFSFAVPVAIVLLILVAVATIVISWLKPNEVQRWLDKVIHFGKNESGAYSDLESQAQALQTLQV